MLSVTITDRDANGVLSLDLRDILRLIGPEAETAEWQVSEVEALDGKAAQELEDLSDRKLKIPGHVLLRLSDNVGQIINGCFEAYRNQASEPWIVIRAVDSSAFDVETDSETLIEQIRRRFNNVADIPAD
jgi:hypothetical protein